MNKIILHTTSSDQKGIVTKYADLLSSLNINITNLEQHVEPDDKLFLMRIAADTAHKDVDYLEFKNLLEQVDNKFNAYSSIYNPDKKLNIAVLVTKESLPLYDILIKNQTGEIESNVKLVISNHKSLESIANQFNIKFCFIDVNKNKNKGNEELKSILIDNDIDLVVLARYMQIIPKDIVKLFSGKMINIHHGFLPAFKGKKPYHRAWKRGVKIIGATSHYVTDELDEGPIISQDVAAVSHHHSINEMIESGRNLERNVLINSIKAHIEYRVIIHGKRTIIFNK